MSDFESPGLVIVVSVNTLIAVPFGNFIKLVQHGAGQGILHFERWVKAVIVPSGLQPVVHLKRFTDPALDKGEPGKAFIGEIFLRKIDDLCFCQLIRSFFSYSLRQCFQVFNNVAFLRSAFA